MSPVMGLIEILQLYCEKVAIDLHMLTGSISWYTELSRSKPGEISQRRWERWEFVTIALTRDKYSRAEARRSRCSPRAAGPLRHLRRIVCVPASPVTA